PIRPPLGRVWRKIRRAAVQNLKWKCEAGGFLLRRHTRPARTGGYSSLQTRSAPKRCGCSLGSAVAATEVPRPSSELPAIAPLWPPDFVLRAFSLLPIRRWRAVVSPFPPQRRQSAYATVEAALAGGCTPIGRRPDRAEAALPPSLSPASRGSIDG